MPVPVFRPAPLNWEKAREFAEKFGEPSVLSNFGPLVSMLEEAVARLVGVENAAVVAFSNATDALTACYSTFEEPLPLVIPGFSFVATLRAAQNAEISDFEIHDVDEFDWTMSKGFIDSGSRLLGPVSPFGADPLGVLNKFPSDPIVVDAAASLGSLPVLSKLASFQAVVFSLHATKIFGAGEGGVAVFGSCEWAEKARNWSNFGRRGDSFAGNGVNSKMSEVQAAFCLARLDEKEMEMQDWRLSQDLALRVSERLGLVVQPHKFDTVHPYWTVLFESTQVRSAVESALSSAGIGFRRWWSQELGSIVKREKRPIAASLVSNTLGLPMFRGLSLAEADFIEEALTRVL